MLRVVDNNPRRRDRTFFRIVSRYTPRRWDFYSNFSRHIPRRGPELTDEDEYHGVSVYDTHETARDRVDRQPKLGAYIARLEITPDLPVRMKSTPDYGGAGHWTLWARPSVLLAAVRDVVRVSPARRRRR